MILGFSETIFIDGKIKETNFVNKISIGDKIHTIRADVKERWKAGNIIHFAVGVRSVNYHQFDTGICESVQVIEIDEDRDIYIDNKPLLQSEIEELSRNDGFDSEEDFWGWFDKHTPFTGKLIHWTKKKY